MTSQQGKQYYIPPRAEMFSVGYRLSILQPASLQIDSAYDTTIDIGDYTDEGFITGGN